MTPGIIAGTGLFGLNAIAQYQSGKAEQALMNAQAGSLTKQAELTRKVGAMKEAQAREELVSFASSQEVVRGMSGVAGTGSATEIMAETARRGEAEALAIRLDALTGGANLLQKAEELKARGRLAKRMATIGAATSVLGGAANLFAAGASSGGYGGSSSKDVA